MSDIATQPAVKLTLRTADGQPAPEVPISLYGADGSLLARKVSGADGTVAAPSGTVAVATGELRGATAALEFNGKESSAVVSPPAAPVVYFGQVVGPTGDGIGGIAVAIRDVQGTVLAHTVTDPIGVWLLPTPADSRKLQLTATGLDNALAVPPAKGRTVGPIPVALPAVPSPERRAVVAPPAVLGIHGPSLEEVVGKAPQLFARGVEVHESQRCNPYAPQGTAAQSFDFRKVFLFPEGKGGTSGGEDNPAGRPIDVAGATPQPDSGLRYGALVVFRQEWQPLGLALGELVHSIPLAPCEQVKVATVEWQGRQRGLRAGSTSEARQDDTTLGRSRVVHDVVDLHSEKHADQSQVAGGLGLSFGNASFGASLGAGATTSWGDELTTATATSAQDLNDSIREISTVLRGTRAVSVVEVSEAEESTVSTRVLRNHNHCHTLTFQYFEVLQRWLVDTHVWDVAPAVLVPFSPLVFDGAAIDRYGDVLGSVLRDEALRPMLDEWLTRSRVRHETRGQATAAPAPVDEHPATRPDLRVESVRLFLTTDTVRNPNFPDGTAGAGVVRTGERQMLREYVGLSTGDTDVRFPDFEGKESQDTPGLTTYDVTAPVSLAVGDLATVAIHNFFPWADVNDNHNLAYFRSAVLEAELSDGRTMMVASIGRTFRLPIGSRVAMDLNPAWTTLARPAPTMAPHPPALPETPAEQPPSAPDAVLVAHLQANAYYYTAAVLVFGDPHRRWMLFNQIRDSAGRLLTEIADPDVLGVNGCYLALRLASAEALPAVVREQFRDGTWWHAATYGPSRADTIVTLPTPGLYAEAQMGTCSAAEAIDETLFWRWQDAPCDDTAPEITADMLQSRHADMGPLLGFAQSSLEPRQVTVPQEPDPITIGDATLAQLAKGLQLHDPAALLGFIGKLAEIAAQSRQPRAAQGGGGAGAATPHANGSTSTDHHDTHSEDTGSSPASGSSSAGGGTATPGTGGAHPGDASPGATPTRREGATTPATTATDPGPTGSTGQAQPARPAATDAPVTVQFTYDNHDISDAATVARLRELADRAVDRHLDIQIDAWASPEERTPGHNRELSRFRGQAVTKVVLDQVAGREIVVMMDSWGATTNPPGVPDSSRSDPAQYPRFRVAVARLAPRAQ